MAGTIEATINLIRHVQASELSYLFARESIIDLPHLSDLHVASLSMAGVSMMNQQFIDEFNLLVKLGNTLALLVGKSDPGGLLMHEELAPEFAKYGYTLQEVPPNPEDSPGNRIGKTILIAEPYEFIIDRWS
jgi:hypothetical protein